MAGARTRDQEEELYKYFDFDLHEEEGCSALFGVIMNSTKRSYAEAACRAFEELFQKLKKSEDDDFIEKLQRLQTITRLMRRNSTSTLILRNRALFPSRPQKNYSTNFADCACASSLIFISEIQRTHQDT